MKILTDAQLTPIMITIPSVNHRLAFELHNLAVNVAMKEKDVKIAELESEVERLRSTVKGDTKVSISAPASEVGSAAATKVGSAADIGSVANDDNTNLIVTWLRRLVGDATTVRALNTKKIADRIEAREFLYK